MNNVNTRIREFVVSVIFCAAAIYVVITAISTGFGFSGALKLAPVFALICLTATIVAQRYWVGLLLAVQASVWSPPLPVLERLSANMILVVLVLAAYVPTAILRRRKTPGVHHQLSSVLMSGLLVITIGWFMLDPPGSAQIGATGGLGEAFAILLGVIAYFFVSYIMAKEWDFKQNWQAYVMVVVLISTPVILSNLKRLANASNLNIFNEVLWFFFPVVLCPVFLRYKQNRNRWNSFVFNMAIPLMMIASIFSAQRSRPFYALFMLTTIAHAYGLKKKLFIRLAVLAIPGILLMAAFPRFIPQSAVRAASILFPMGSDVAKEMYGIRGEVGWNATWRANLTKLAWNQIRLHPVLGKGFSYSLDEITRAAWAHGGQFGLQTGLYRGLAVSGGYHNGLLTLAVFCGIPAALLFAVALLLVAKKFITVLPDINDVWLKYLSVSVMASFVPYTCHMLINGSGPQIFRLCVMMGGVNGILWRLKQEPALVGTGNFSNGAARKAMNKPAEEIPC
jgi:hypothetical protein